MTQEQADDAEVCDCTNYECKCSVDALRVQLAEARRELAEESRMVAESWRQRQEHFDRAEKAEAEMIRLKEQSNAHRDAQIRAEAALAEKSKECVKAFNEGYDVGFKQGRNMDAHEKAVIEAAKNPPGCSREGLCREKWEGPSEHDDCYSCAYRQRIERLFAALTPRPDGQEKSK